MVDTPPAPVAAADAGDKDTGPPAGLVRGYANVMLFVAVAGYVYLAIGAFYIVARGSAGGVSPAALFTHLAVSCMFITYARFRGDLIYKISATVAVALNLVVLACVLSVQRDYWFAEKS